MMFSSILAYWAFSFLFVLTPGVDWAYVISVSDRRRAIAPAVTGLLLGHLTAVVLVAAGVGAIVTKVPLALTVLTVLGAAYLVWLGISLIRNPPVPHSAGQLSGVSWRQYLIKGYGLSGLNPKVPLLYLALMPQFTDATGTWPLSAQIIALGITTIISCAIIYTLVGLASHSILRANPGVSKTVGRISGGVMIIVAIVLLVEQFWR